MASATCLEDFDLKEFVPVLTVGKGAGAAQSAVDTSAINRRLMRRGFLQGLTPAEIFQLLRSDGDGNLQTRQYGIVTMRGDAFTFSGSLNGAAAAGRRGELGSIKYAIQGNVIVGAEVVDAATEAFEATEGDLSQRIMAAMGAARDMGGDGRCSCRQNAPTACGAPPPSFDKTAHVGFIVLARIGDVDGVCDRVQGCANGDYFLCENVIGSRSDPDPVFVLQRQYDAWRYGLRGRPDALLSEVKPAVEALSADGVSRTLVRIQLNDVEGQPLRQGGAQVKVFGVPEKERILARPSGVVDHGDGSYSFEVRAGTLPGTQRFEIRVDDGIRPVVLYPHTEIRLDPLVSLRTQSRPSGGRGEDSLTLSVQRDPSPGAPFVLALSQDGRWVRGAGKLTGRLDVQGKGELRVSVPAALRAGLSGELRWHAFVIDGGLHRLGSVPWDPGVPLAER